MRSARQRELSLEPNSIRIFVIHTSPRICVHSDTMLPTTCPHRLPVSMRRKAHPHPIQVITRNTVSECSRRNSSTGDFQMPFGFLLSADPFSYRCLVMRTVTSTPVQSAIALPKNEPRWVDGSDRM